MRKCAYCIEALHGCLNSQIKVNFLLTYPTFFMTPQLKLLNNLEVIAQTNFEICYNENFKIFNLNI